MLRDTACFSSCNRGVTERVKESRFAVIDVALRCQLRLGSSRYRRTMMATTGGRSGCSVSEAASSLEISEETLRRAV